MKTGDQPPKTWGRLKAAKQDSLESMGLPSKGDESLLDWRTQERYYGDILNRCLHVSVQGNEDASLDRSFEALSLSGEGIKQPNVGHGSAQESSALDRLYRRNAGGFKDVSVIVQAMRKLREAIVATGRTDAFAQNVYVFIIRATILVRHIESYHPALLHLLNIIHPRTRLSEITLHEMLGYHILDRACRQQNLNAAYRVRYIYGIRDSKIDDLIRSIVHGSWFAFWKTDGLMDRYQRCLSQAAHDKMRHHTLGCLAKSYLSIERKSIEEATHKAWDELKREYCIQWQAEGELVTIKQARRK
ncbi:MAG: hypothetical protein Q9217_003367 [Psora testacea]